MTAESHLERVKRSRRPVTAVEARCARRGHLLLSVHPIHTPEGWRLLLWVRPGRMSPSVADDEHWKRHGLAPPAEEGFTGIGEYAETLTPYELPDHRPMRLACRCSVAQLEGSQLYEAATDWLDRREGTDTRPVCLTV